MTYSMKDIAIQDIKNATTKAQLKDIIKRIGRVTQQEWAEYLQSKKLKTDTKYQGTKIFLTNENGNNDQLQHTTHTNTKTQTSQRRLGQMVQRHA